MNDKEKKIEKLRQQVKDCLSAQNCDGAIEAADLLLKLDPKNHPEAYYARGITYAIKDDYDRAIADLAKFYELGRKDEVLAYIAYRIKKTNPENPGALLNAFMSVWFSVMKITEELHLSPDSNSFPVVHYCSLRTLKSMIKGERFRFYNATHMDDPKEGEEFFSMMGDKDKGIRDYFYKDDRNRYKYPSSCYIGSFVANENKDEHIFWQMYGKDKGIGEAGCNLIFERWRFSSELRVKTAGMGASEKLPMLFSVFYHSMFDRVDKDERMKKMLGKLKNELEELKNKIIKEYPEHKEELKSLVCELIDSVRYLFKSSYYSKEEEVRVIEFRAPEEDIKTDDSGADSPKFYIDPYEEFIFDKVILGPKINDVDARSNAWRFWIRKKFPDAI